MWPKPTIPKIFQQEGVTVKQWTDWRWQLSHSIRTAELLQRYSGLSSQKTVQIKKIIEHRYQNGRDQMRLTPYLLSLMDLSDSRDPIALQHLPSLKELEPDFFTFDKIWENEPDFDGDENRLLQQKYPDVALLRLSNTCHSFCRFCFQKERTLRGDVKTIVGDTEFDRALRKIRRQKQLRQVLISGGDPLVLPDNILKKRLSQLMKIPQLSSIRINTRTLLHNPFRITEEFAQSFASLQKESWQTFTQKGRGRGKQIQLGVHFNHPQELTSEAIFAIRLLESQGIEIYNQTVLLKGINDDPETLQRLFRKLRRENVRLHYLSHAMTVPRTSHFRTSLRRGLELLDDLKKTKEFRGQLPHYETCHFSGKQVIDSFSEELYEGFMPVKGKKVPIIRFLSQITGKWEVQPDGED